MSLWRNEILHPVRFHFHATPIPMPTTVKEEARRLVDALDDDASWDDLMYRLYVRQSIERGLEDSDADRVMSVQELRQRLASGGAPREA